jgi:hypothetical protein
MWRDTVRRFTDARDAQGAILELFRQYERLSPAERREIDSLLAESLGSSDEDVRFDALALIDEYRIASTLPQLQSLASRLLTETTPGAPFELAKVQRLLDRLNSSGEQK